MPSDPVVIASFARTPIGAFQGALAGARATELGATAVREAVGRSGAAPETVERIMPNGRTIRLDGAIRMTPR